MYHTLAQQMLMDFDTNPIEHSQAVTLGGVVALVAQVQLLNCTLDNATLTVTIDISDDLENWRDSGIAGAEIENVKQGLDHTNDGEAVTISAEHARLRYELTAAADTHPRALVRAGLDVSPN